jgi:hypothetical protein
MAKIAAALLVIASFLLVAPVLESGTTKGAFFVAVGNAEDAGGE